MGWLIITAIILGLQAIVMWLAIKCDIRRDKQTECGSKERARAQWWNGMGMGTLVLFLFGIAAEFIGFIYFLVEVAPDYDREVYIKCETIEGEFSKKLNACYKNGVKIVFNEGEQVYGE